MYKTQNVAIPLIKEALLYNTWEPAQKTSSGHNVANDAVNEQCRHRDSLPLAIFLPLLPGRSLSCRAGAVMEMHLLGLGSP